MTVNLVYPFICIYTQYLSVLVFKRMLKDVAEDLYQHHRAVLDQLGVIVLVVQELQ